MFILLLFQFYCYISLYFQIYIFSYCTINIIIKGWLPIYDIINKYIKKKEHRAYDTVNLNLYTSIKYHVHVSFIKYIMI